MGSHRDHGASAGAGREPIMPDLFPDEDGSSEPMIGSPSISTDDYDSGSSMHDDGIAKRKTQSDGYLKPILIALAVLVVAWLFWDRGSEPITEQPSELESPTMETISGEQTEQLQRLSARVDALEAALHAQRHALEQRIDNLTRRIDTTHPVHPVTPHITPITPRSTPTKTSATQSQHTKQPHTKHAAAAHIQHQQTQTSPSANRLQLPAPITSASLPAGHWVINLISVGSLAGAQKALNRLAAKGIKAEVAPAQVNGKTWYRVRVSGFKTRAAAERRRDALAQQYGMKDMWVHEN